VTAATRAIILVFFKNGEPNNSISTIVTTDKKPEADELG
jgi:hypothetical protein